MPPPLVGFNGKYFNNNGLIDVSISFNVLDRAKHDSISIKIFNLSIAHVSNSSNVISWVGGKS